MMMKIFLKPYIWILFIILSSRLFAQPYTVLHTFGGSQSDGKSPQANPVMIDNVLYGVTDQGGDNTMGVFFKVNADGTNYTIIRSFSNNVIDCYAPIGGLLEVNGLIYCMSVDKLFSLTTDGEFTLIHTFGDIPNDAFGGSGGYLFNIGNIVYGLTGQGGDGRGAIFKYDITNSEYLVQFRFPDGTNPPREAFGQVAVSGNIIYGTTLRGGTDDLGTIFSLDFSNNDFNILYSFSGGAGGANPLSGVVFLDNHIYGTTYFGGTNDWGDYYEYGMIFGFNINNNDFNVIHNFYPVNDDGVHPDGSFKIGRAHV